MKYFTKWLPTEHPIIKGDMIIHLPTLNIIHAKYQSVIDELSEKGMLNQYRQRKLFLCTKDIEIGDSVVEDGVFVQFEWTMMMDSNIPTDGRIFKIIGEISPKALEYIKEDMSFTEEDYYWKFFPRHSHLDDEAETTVYWDEYDEPDITRTIPILNVKGPCGHYH